jgi:hypothetical protein
MVEGGAGSGLSKKTIAGLLARQGLGIDDFERNRPFEPHVDGFENDPHPAFADLFDDAVLAYRFTDEVFGAKGGPCLADRFVHDPSLSL